MSRAVSVDAGTMFFQAAENAEDGSLNLKEIRNSFVELEASEDIEQVLEQNDWQYVSDGRHYYVIGEDSMRVARMFPGKVELRRPMQGGVLNKGEDKKMLVMAKMIESSIGKAPDDKSVVCTCVSSDPVDDAVDNTFHRARLEGMFKRLGWHVKVIEEGHAVVLAERPVLVEEDGEEVPFSGLGISFGAGKVNCVLAYRGLPVVGMSAARCLSKDFMVLSDNGYKRIEDVEVGDKVIDAYGNTSQVDDVINNGKRDKLLNIKIDNLPFIVHKMTKDHRVFIKRDNKWEWVESCELKVGDIIGEPVVKHDKNRRSYYYGFNKNNKEGMYGNMSRNLGRIIGLFLGDGSTNFYKSGSGNDVGYIQWAFNANDDDLINEYVEIISSYFGQNVSLSYENNLLRMKLHNTAIAKHFKNKFYDANGKKICSIPLSHIPDQMAVGIVQGLLDSDGNVNNRNGYDFCNTSLDICIMFHRILGRFGIFHSFTNRSPRKGGINQKGVQIIGRKEVYTIRICGLPYNILNLLFSFDNTGFPVQINDMMEYKIKEILEEDYNDFVYDLSINSSHHSFSGLGCVVHNCGDWIDKKVSDQTDVPVSQVTAIKEKKLDFKNIDYNDDVIFALNAYYTNMLEYVFKNFSKKFAKVKSQFEVPIDIVIAGGTSMPKGFRDKVDKVVRSLELPFDVKDVIHSKDPRNSVVKGCLTQAIITQKRLEKSSLDKMLD